MKTGKLRVILIASVCAGFLCSCASRSSMRFKKLAPKAEKSEYLGAVQLIQKNPDLYGKTNRYLFYMDIGLLFHYEGKFDSSSFYLGRALEIYDELFAKSVTNEAASILTNDNIRPYRSKPYELTLLHQIQALNYMAEGRFDESLVETRRMQLHFDEWARDASKENRYSSDGMFHYLSSIAYDAAGEEDNAVISLFKAVEAYQKGVVALPHSVQNLAYYRLKNSGRESDIDLLKLQSDLPEDKIPSLDNASSEIILIGYAGKGPVIEELSWWGTYVRDGLLMVHYNGPDGRMETITLPAPGLPQQEVQKAQQGNKTLSGTTFHIKFAMPSLQTIPSLTNYFSVSHSSLQAPVRTEVINNFDDLAAGNLEDTKTNTLIRTVIRVVIRTIASQKTKSGLSGSNPIANLLVNVGTDVLADQLEKADTRSCFLIPKTIQIARIPVEPGTHQVEVAAHDRSGRPIGTQTFSGIEVGKGRKKVIFYSSLK